MHNAPSSYERFVWYFQRITGLAIIALVFVHLFVMHVLNEPSRTITSFVAARWALAGWRIFDGMLLLLALTHGLAGTHAMIRQSVTGRRARRIFDIAFVAMATAFSGLGLGVILATPHLPSAHGILSAARWIPDALDVVLAFAATLTYLAIMAIGATFAVLIAQRRSLGWWTFPSQWAFALNRSAGVGILAFLLVHVLDVALVPTAPDLYDRVVQTYALPYLVPMEVLLVAAVVYHALNGLRLMVLESLNRDAERALTLSFAGVLGLTVLLTVPTLLVLLQ